MKFLTTAADFYFCLYLFSMENFVKEESETDDQEELESFLYSQIHYMEDNPEEETPPPPVQSCLVGDVKPISNHKIEDETMRVSLI